MPDEDEQSWGRYLGFGMEMAVGVGLGAFVGQWLDKRYNWAPWGTMVGALVGLFCGMYPLIKAGLKANKD